MKIDAAGSCEKPASCGVPTAVPNSLMPEFALSKVPSNVWMQTRRSSIGIRWFKLSLRNQICFLFSNFRKHCKHPICSLIVEDIARIGRFLES
jgi:hypothetical protein